MENAVSVDDFTFNMACRMAQKCEPALVIEALAISAVKLWALVAVGISIEEQDALLEDLFKDMRIVMAECQKNTKTPEEN